MDFLSLVKCLWNGLNFPSDSMYLRLHLYSATTTTVTRLWHLRQGNAQIKHDSWMASAGFCARSLTRAHGLGPLNPTENGIGKAKKILKLNFNVTSSVTSWLSVSEQEEVCRVNLNECYFWSCVTVLIFQIDNVESQDGYIKSMQVLLPLHFYTNLDDFQLFKFCPF